ncbi:Transcription factor TFIIIB component B'' -like protein [Echinococcus granulosus]|uniref:Transcription factor TFIIIB component B n=1 Tax=Echinococcus granulosus TaxID=6210 RepID=U6JCC2_ECHGR|nr:Transcription factor TFIIIB component B'' [Echinococcus granulosus]EUB61047.1 Transcription factor TFIIIB component B'' [Echinococcus granulosus]KAH9284724.1 Transcription factor TFIIIB component B'' -like protein [Echinococcus granulosus]CDS21699.1 transcription factor TFIIIB component B'' [Echinococcus granulosus]
MPKIFKPKIKGGLSQRSQKTDEKSVAVAQSQVATSADPLPPEDNTGNEPSTNTSVEHQITVSVKAKEIKTPENSTTSSPSSTPLRRKAISPGNGSPPVIPSPLVSVDIDEEPFKSPHKESTSSSPIKLFVVKQAPRRHQVYGDAPPPADKPLDRSTVTLRSLLNWIPANKPPPRIRDIQPNPKPSKPETPRVTSHISKSDEKFEDTTTPAPGEPHIDPLAPQLRLDADGNIVLDEQSLQISRPENATEDLRHVAEEAGLYGTTYNSFRRRPVQHRGRKWTERDTTRFYRALSTIGTDFYCMTKLFPDRTRSQLLKKFKREERLFPHLVDEALKNKRNYDITVFYKSESDSEEKYEKLTKDAIVEKRKAPKDKSSQRTPKKRSFCDISAIIDEVLARDATGPKNDEGDPIGPRKVPKTTSAAASAAAPCSLVQMIEKTVEESSKAGGTEKPLSSGITS